MHDISVYQKYARDLLDDPFYWFLERRPAVAGPIYLVHAVAFFVGGLIWGSLWYGGLAAGLQMGSSLLV